MTIRRICQIGLTGAILVAIDTLNGTPNMRVDGGRIDYHHRVNSLFDTEVKLTASDGAASDWFGYSICIDGDTAIVGAPYDDDVASSSGSAYIFQRDEGGADNWGEVAKLTASDPATGHQFGHSVAISGDTAVVGARRDDDAGTYSGSVYVFQRDQGGVDNWGEVTKVTASDGEPYDELGFTVSISGNTVIAGAVWSDDAGGNSGSAYIFDRNEGGGNNWGEVAKLTASDAASGDNFGYSVSVSGDVAIVGARYDDDAGGNSGSAYVFQRDHGGSNTWGEATKLTASDAAGSDFFGYSVSTTGGMAIVGATGDDDAGSGSGSAYVFQRDRGGADNWGQVTKLTAADAAGGDGFGRAVSVSGGTAIVGARNDDDAGSNSGSGYVFQRNQGGADNWGQAVKLTASDGAAFDVFGSAVSISSTAVIVGAYSDDDFGSASGSTYVFFPPVVETDCNGNDVADACDIDCGVPNCAPPCGASADCNGNGVPDECDADCQPNGVPDDCDITDETSQDCNTNGIPDECEVDTDEDGAIDDCDGCPDDPLKTDPGLCGCADAPADCDDGDACTADSCVEGIGCVSDGTGVTTGCDDGDACTTGDACQGDEAGTCAGTDTSAVDCNDGKVCTTDSCDPATGCINDGTGVTVTCDDGSTCTTDDQCQGDSTGTCIGTPIPDCAECSVPGDCDDGDLCNGSEDCEDGVCLSGTSPNCDDGNACTVDSCAPATGCINDGTGITVACDDGNACTTNDTCESDEAGTCAGTDTSAAECNDGNVCTADSCDPATGCINDGTGITATCDDGSTCTTDDQCQGDAAGTCMGTPIPDCAECSVPGDCDDGDLCNGSEDCEDGICISGTSPDCNDGNACTVDSCDPATGCINNGTGITVDCDDGDACTTGDACQGDEAGTCSGTDTSAADCNDGNICTTDSCDPATGCINNGTGITVACDDGNACTTDDACEGDEAGTCSGTDTSAADCNDGNICTADSCDPASGCINDGTDITVTCDDGNACTTDDACQGDEAGTCSGSDTSSADCNDGNICTTDSCDPATGCINDGTGITVTCDDGDACTTDDECQGDAEGTCAGTDTSATDCDDGNQCTADTCDATTGCDNTTVADGTGCDDSEFCTVVDVCMSGICGGSPRDCSDVADQCNSSVCDDAIDECLPEPVTDGTPCPDGDFCNGEETCASGTCADQSDPCVDLPHCDEINDICLECISAAECDDGLWCNGSEACDDLGCQPGSDRCPAACDEENDACLNPPGLPSDEKHHARKHRYLSIDPTTNPLSTTVIKVEIAEMKRCLNDARRGCLVDLDCRDVCEDEPNTLCPTGAGVCGGGACIDSGPCVDVTPMRDRFSAGRMWDRFSTGRAPVAWLVQEPQQITDGCLAPGCDPATENCCGDEDWVARLSNKPYVDANNWSSHAMIHISDCAIVPGITYHVYACDPANTNICSEPLAVGTQATPSGTHLHFGDIAGPPINAGDPYEPPDGFVNVVDVSAWGLTKQNYGTPTSPQLHPTMADLHGSGYGVPANYILGLSDQQAIINHGFTWALPWDNPDMLGGVDPSTCPGRLP